ncbi:hypothetical protein BSP21_116 [Bacillus phage BSP21]|nr:hypothetical protein BSP21_116 [Bacillus phage BSP21]
MNEKYITLEGYNDRTVKFSKAWLEKALAPNTIEDFLDTTTNKNM